MIDYPDYLKSLELLQRYYQQQPKIIKKVTCILSTLQQLAQRQLPSTDMPYIPLTAQDYWTALNHDPQHITLLDNTLNDFRQVLIEQFGIWHLPNQQWINDLHHFISGRTSLEIMAGNGVISAQLSQLGDDILATDNLNWHGQDNETPTPWLPVVHQDALHTVQQKAHLIDVIILSWAPDTSYTDLDILRWLRSNHWPGDFIVIGEKNGSTNSSAFWQAATLTQPQRLNQHHQPFDYFQDQVWLVK